MPDVNLAELAAVLNDVGADKAFFESVSPSAAAASAKPPVVNVPPLSHIPGEPEKPAHEEAALLLGNLNSLFNPEVEAPK